MMSFIIPQRETAKERDRRIGAMQTEMVVNPPTDVGSGIQSVANALLMQNMQRQRQFPAMPEGGKVAPFQGMKNLFGLGGGLY